MESLVLTKGSHLEKVLNYNYTDNIMLGKMIVRFMGFVLNLCGGLIIIGTAILGASLAPQEGGNVLVWGIVGLIIGFMFMVITCGVAFLFLEMNNNLIRIKEILEQRSDAASRAVLD